MRAEQLLAESDLPSSMKRHAIHYTGSDNLLSNKIDLADWIFVARWVTSR